MKRIYEPLAYGPAPLAEAYWPTTTQISEPPGFQGTHDTEVAIIGAGVTGLNAALHLAQSGTQTTVLDAQSPAWGASGRNGGFCCLGGGILESAQLDKLYGQEQRRAWHNAEKAAVSHVKSLLDTHSIDADTHSIGETCLAHRPRDWATLEKHADAIANTYDITPQLIPQNDLKAHGMSGPFHGALTNPIGFGLNPMKYATGLANAAQTAGAKLFANAPVTRITRNTQDKPFSLQTPTGTLRADKLVIATNGYSAEDVPDWMRARFMPVQSSILVTRPLTNDEISAAGWSSDQMAFDTRNLLHYFRLMPNRRFLFGARGGIFATPRREAAIRQTLLSDFKTMFPAWSHVEIPNVWSGLVCLTAKGLPFCGPIPEMPGAYASFGYHGNGVAMGSYCGYDIARQVLDKNSTLPDMLKSPPNRFPFGSKRRWILPPLYTAMSLKDR